MSVRPEPTNCQHEPPYPDLETVVFSIRATDTVAHYATADCGREEPHLIAECGCFTETEGEK